MKIVVGVNTLTSVDQPVYSNHCQWWYHLGRHTNHTFILNHPRRMSIDRMRNITAKIALENNADYLLFIDDDVLIPHDTLERLLACETDIACGWTLIRGYPFKNMFFKYKDEQKTILENYQDFTLNDKGLIDCDAIGFSCALIKCDLLRKVEPPYFVTGPYNTEDIYFCIKAKRDYPEMTIVVDPNVKTSHNLGSEYLDPLNKEHYKDYYMKSFPELAIEGTPEAIKQPSAEELNMMTYEKVLQDSVG